MPQDKISRPLTIYLIKNDIRDPQVILSDINTLSKHEIKGIGQLYVRPSRQNLPNWTSLFKDVLDLRSLQSISSSTAAVLLIKSAKRIFAITFGVGRHLLESGCHEERFGLLVTLNSVSSVRSIDKKTFDAISRQTREQASHEVTPSEFGLDVEQDILQAVTGTPNDPSLGTRLTGIDSLSVSVKANLSDIPSLLHKYYDKFQETTYRDNFPWVDQIAETNDVQLIEQLNAKLLNSIRAEEFDRLWLSVPEIIKWADVSGFKYSEARQAHLYEDINFPSFLDSIRKRSELNINTLIHRKIFCFSSSGDYAADKWPVYQCIYYEVEHNNNTYLLTGAKWYKVEPRFVEQINRYVQGIPTSRITLPRYSDQSEDAYINRVYDTDRITYAIMHEKLINHGGGHSSVEFCDLFTNTKKIIHIKRYGGSNVLSHLFSQGLVAAELFLMDSEFRRLVNVKLPRSHKYDRVSERPRPQDYEIIFAIISQQVEGLTLPLFSRINLRHAARRLLAYGYKVSIAKIQAPPPPSQMRLL